MHCAFVLALTLSTLVFGQSIFDDDWEPPRSEQREKVDPPVKEEVREEEPAQPEPEPMKEEPVVADEPVIADEADNGRIRLDDNRFDEPKNEVKPPELAEEPPVALSNLLPTEQKLRMGLSQLKDDNAREALATFQSLLNELPKPTSPKLDDPNRINAMHGLAVAYMHLGDLPKARQQMDRIYACPKTNRSIALNQAIIDVQSRDTVRAATNLVRYLEMSKDDERAINLLGLAIKRAVKEKRGTTIKKHVEDYLRFDAQLEKSRPDMKRWGSSWIDPDEHKGIMSRRDKQIATCKAISARLEKAENELARAKTEYRRVNQSGGSAFSQQRVIEAEQRADAIADELTRERRKIVNPAWVEDFTPVLPELELKNK